MPKAKSKKLLLKRLKITKNGKIMRRQSFRRHLKASKSKKQLKNLKKTIEMVGYQAKKFRKFLGITLREDKKK